MRRLINLILALPLISAAAAFNPNSAIENPPNSKIAKTLDLLRCFFDSNFSHIPRKYAPSFSLETPCISSFLRFHPDSNDESGFIDFMVRGVESSKV